MTELLSCPFCGGVAELDSSRGYNSFPGGRPRTEVAIYCLGCGVDMAVDPEEIGEERDSVVRQLIAAWNRRASAPSSAAVRLAELQRLARELYEAREIAESGGPWDTQISASTALRTALDALRDGPTIPVSPVVPTGWKLVPVKSSAVITKSVRAATQTNPEPSLCPDCAGGGWECFGLGRADPHFRECQTCGNPEGHSSP